MADMESCIARIVNLDDCFTEDTLKELIFTKCQPQGNVKQIYLKRSEFLKIFFGYLIFEYSYDALKTVQILNGHTQFSNKLEAELIGPNLKYRKYEEVSSARLISSLSEIREWKYLSSLYQRRGIREQISEVPSSSKNNNVSLLSRIASIQEKRLTERVSAIPSSSKYIPPHLLKDGMQNNGVGKENDLYLQ